MRFSSFFRFQSADDTNSPRWRLWILLILAVSLILATLPFIYAGTLSRYQADDYCSAQLLRTEGFWGAQWESYTGWSNRFSTMLVTGLIDPLDVVGMQILPGVLIAGLLASTMLLFHRLRSLLGVKVNGVILFSLSALIVFIALYTTPDQFQSYYWRSGSITYTLPIFCLVFLLGILIERREKRGAWWQMVLIALFSFFAGGFSETNAALQICVLALGLVGVLWGEKRTGQRIFIRSWWVAALLGLFLAIVVILLSPGNAIRMSQMPEPPGFFSWLYLSFRFGLGFVYNGITGTILPRAVSFLLGIGFALQFGWKNVKYNPIGWSLVILPIVVFLLVVACCAPSAYAQSAYPENRAFTGANFVLTAGMVMEGFLLGILIQIWRSKSSKRELKSFRVMWAAAVIFLCFYILYGGTRILDGIQDYKTRAEAWDARVAQIEQLRQSGDRTPEVIALDSYRGVMELSADPDLWVNRCAASYYQVDTITAISSH